MTSRDIRAPNLSELFAAPVTTTLPTFFDPFNNRNVLALQYTTGDPGLTPELARNTTAGIALSNPSWFPGLSASFDWYRIKIDDVIGSLGAGDIVNYCFGNILPATCDAFNLNNPNGPNFINVQSFNFASIETEGFDIEASYQWRNPLNLGGSFVLRGLATHVAKYVSDTGLPNTIPSDSAGQNFGATPNWKWLLTQSYSNDQFSFLVQERWFTSGVINTNYVECDPGQCPVSTPVNQTISPQDNFVPGAFYLDVGGTYNLTEEVTAYFKVDNLFDEDPALSPFFSNPALYDALGRTYRAGVRFQF